MIYSDSTAVTKTIGGLPTREQYNRNGNAVVTPGPDHTARDLPQVFWIIAFSLDPFVSALCAITPLAGRKIAAPFLPRHFLAAPNSPLGLVRVLRGTTTFSLGGFQR